MKITPAARSVPMIIGEESQAGTLNCNSPHVDLVCAVVLLEKLMLKNR